MNKLKILRNSLLSIVDNIDTGNSNVPTDDECEEIINTINKVFAVERKYSKYQAYEYLGLSRATFDRYVKDGLIPEGRKESGFKEKFWYKHDLDVSRNKILNIRGSSSSSN